MFVLDFDCISGNETEKRCESRIVDNMRRSLSFIVMFCSGMIVVEFTLPLVRKRERIYNEKGINQTRKFRSKFRRVEDDGDDDKFEK